METLTIEWGCEMTPETEMLLTRVRAALSEARRLHSATNESARLVRELLAGSGDALARIRQHIEKLSDANDGQMDSQRESKVQGLAINTKKYNNLISPPRVLESNSKILRKVRKTTGILEKPWKRVPTRCHCKN